MEAAIYLSRVCEDGATRHRVRYAISNILRDRVVNEGAFRVCFEMGDQDQVVTTILRRGLKNPRLRAALERSHLIELNRWLQPRPDLAEAYLATAVPDIQRPVESGTPPIDKKAPGQESGREASR
jgi:hypothetical protein